MGDLLNTVSYKAAFESGYFQDSTLHCHRYTIEVTVSPLQNKKHSNCDIKILDYRTLGKVVKNVVPDGCWLVGSDNTSLQRTIAQAIKDNEGRVMVYDCVLNLESLCRLFANEIQCELDEMGASVNVIRVKLYETANAFATWSLDD